MKSLDKKHKIYYTKDAFSLNYSFYKGKEIVGYIKDKSTIRSVKASIFGMNFLFESEGFFKPDIVIIDMNEKVEVGKVTFTLFQHKGKIRIGRKPYLWKFENFFCTKWSLTDLKEGSTILFKSRKEGYFTVKNKEAGLLLLTNFIVRNHIAKSSGI